MGQAKRAASKCRIFWRDLQPDAHRHRANSSPARLRVSDFGVWVVNREARSL